MKKNLKWIACGLFLIIFLLLGYLVLKGDDIYIDSFVYNLISPYISKHLTTIIKLITNIGGAIIVIGITILTIIIFKNERYGIFMMIDLVCITIIQLIVKSIFSRSRPIDINLIEESGYSFPSGHSLTAMAFYGFIIYLIYNSKLNIRSKKIYILLFTLLIFITGISRIYLGVHYFTDVLGGFTLSISYLIIYTSIIKKYISYE